MISQLALFIVFLPYHYKTDALRFLFLAIANCAIQHESKYFCGKILAEGVYQHMPYDAGFYWMVACLF